jgi:hypothetical protein
LIDLSLLFTEFLFKTVIQIESAETDKERDEVGAEKSAGIRWVRVKTQSCFKQRVFQANKI